MIKQVKYGCCSATYYHTGFFGVLLRFLVKIVNIGNVPSVIKMPEEIEKPTVKLVGEDGNAFAIIGRVCIALRKVGHNKEYIDRFAHEAMAGDYDNVLRVCMKYVNVV